MLRLCGCVQLRSLASVRGISDAGALVAALPLRNIIQFVADGLEIALGAPRTRQRTNIMRVPVPLMFNNYRRTRPRPFRQPGNFGLTRAVLGSETRAGPTTRALPFPPLPAAPLCATSATPGRPAGKGAAVSRSLTLDARFFLFHVAATKCRIW